LNAFNARQIVIDKVLLPASAVPELRTLDVGPGIIAQVVARGQVPDDLF